MIAILKVLKVAWPFLLAGAMFGGGYFQGRQDGLAKSYNKAVKEEIAKIKIPECPKCETCPPCNGIDFDKIKGRNITVQNHQHITASMDSLAFAKLLNDIKAAMDERDMVRVKRR